MLQTHAAVYTGHQHRSFHGTTVQLVQPLCDLNNRRSRSDTPSNSPHKQGKVGPKRRRTTIPIEKKLKTTSINSNASSSNQCYQQLSLEGFQESESELKERIKVTNNILCCMLLRVAAIDTGLVFGDIRRFLCPSTSVPCERFETFKRGEEEWVVLAGDGKTYQHQITIMKIYFSAGLREIAAAAGHNFLLQVWEALYRCILLAYVNSCQHQPIKQQIKEVLSCSIENETTHLCDVYTNLSTPETSGWILKDNGCYDIDWEDPSEESQEQEEHDPQEESQHQEEHEECSDSEDELETEVITEFDDDFADHIL